MANIYSSIWKDVYYEDTGTKAYYLTKNGSIIFQGKAYARPDTGRCKINISNICRDYLSTQLDGDLRAGMYQHPDALVHFELVVSGIYINDYYFLNCWDYRTNYNDDTLVLSNPVNGHYEEGQLKPYTRVVNGSVSTSMYTSTQTGYRTLSCPNRGIYHYALLYKNAKGGYDSFLIEGLGKRTDNIKTYQIGNTYNDNRQEFGIQDYTKVITPTYSLTTHYLTDAESENIAENIIPSTEVYLQNITNGTIVPVVITDTSATYKTLNGEGRKRYQQTINVAESQKKIR